VVSKVVGVSDDNRLDATLHKHANDVTPTERGSIQSFMHQVTQTAEGECKYATIQERQSKAAMT